MRTRHLWLCVGVAAMFFACERNTTYVEEVAGPAACTDCHNDTDVITAKHAQWEESLHGSGEAYLRGTSGSCAACHSGDAFVTQVVEGGKAPNQATGDPDPTRQDCRTCHNIHETFTAQDWSLQTTAPVALYAMVGTPSFNGGQGNLCVNCHQPRRDAPVANAQGMITEISEHWGPHHGPQSTMILGLGGAGVPTGPAHQHYGVANTCVQCHVGLQKVVNSEIVEGDKGHTFEPAVASCQLPACHPGATSLDINGRQTEIICLADQLGDLLVTAGLLSENSLDGHPTVTEAPEDEGIALWNWLYVHHEDKSFGVHNYPYTRALLEEGLTRMGATPDPACSAP